MADSSSSSSSSNSSNNTAWEDDEDGLYYPNSSEEYNSSDSEQTTISCSPHSPVPPLHKVHTQQVDHVVHDHLYCLAASENHVQHKMTQCDEISYFLLQNDADALLFTGIALETFNILLSALEGYANKSFTMSVRDQVLMTLMKLKTNRVIGDLSRQFGIPQSMASNIISYWIDKLEEVLRPLIPWLPRESIQATMPAAFKENFPNTTCIVHCGESLVQKPQNLDSGGKLNSHYHSHNSVKYLVAVAPCGLIMFISAAYGERCSGRFITMDSGILDLLMPGDEVMADANFPIKDFRFERKINVVIPSFTKQHGPLMDEQVTCTGETEHVRVHVERAIRCLKVYKILSEVVSIAMAPKIDRILRICAALVNLGED